MLRQNETLQKVDEYNGYKKMVRLQPNGDTLVVEYHDDDYFVRTAYVSGEWRVSWYDSGARPLGDVGHYDDKQDAIDAAQDCFKGIIRGERDPRP